LQIGKTENGAIFTIEKRDISYKELFEDSSTEIFCTGTAAVITTICSITSAKKRKVFNRRKPDKITTTLYELLIKIQRQAFEDPYGCIEKI
jgi:branched-subunit amino acid aminotransferase/4-amino-4-deoxychorismate lyase